MFDFEKMLEKWGRKYRSVAIATCGNHLSRA